MGATGDSDSTDVTSAPSETADSDADPDSTEGHSPSLTSPDVP